MTKWIKTAALALVVMMIFAAFAGCAKDTDTVSQAPTQASQQPSDAVVEETGTLKLGIWPQDDLTEEIKLHEGYVERFKEIHPNIEAVPAYYHYAVDTFLPLAESGNLPTVFETWYTEPQKLINQGLIADITDEVNAKGWADAMNPSIRNLLTKDGRMYGIPRDGYALGLMLNVELFEQAGLVDADGLPIYPKTWDELAQTAKTIKDKTGAAGLCLLAQDNAGGWHFSNIAWNFGAELEKEVDGKWMAQLNSPEAVAAMQYVYDLKWKYDVLTADPITENWGTGFVQLGTGGAAMYIGAQDAVNQPTFVNKLPVDKLSLIPMPKGPGGKQYMLMGGTPYVFSKDATPAEIVAGLDYIEIMGFAPVVSEGIEADAKYRSENGIPVIPRFPVYISPEYKAAVDAANEKYRNIDWKLFQDYYKAIETEGVLHLEEPKMTQEMYAELTKVLQAVLTDKNANIQALMDTADANLQTVLDANVNK